MIGSLLLFDCFANRFDDSVLGALGYVLATVAQLLCQLPHRSFVVVVPFEQGSLTRVERSDGLFDGFHLALMCLLALFDEVNPRLDLLLNQVKPFGQDAFVVERSLQVLVRPLAEVLVSFVDANARHVSHQVFRLLGKCSNHQLFQKDQPGVLQNVFGVEFRNPVTLRQKFQHFRTSQFLLFRVHDFKILSLHIAKVCRIALQR